MVEFFQFIFFAIMWCLVWYISFKEFSPYTLVSCLLLLGLSVGGILHKESFPFMGFVAYMGMVAGVVVLLAYIVALGGGHFERGKSKVGKSVSGTKLKAGKVSLAVRWVTGCSYITMVSLYGLDSASDGALFALMNIFLPLVYEIVSNFISEEVSLIGKVGSFTFLRAKIALKSGFNLYTYLRLSPYWGYICVFLAVLLFVVMVGCMSITDCYSGALVKKKPSSGFGLDKKNSLSKSSGWSGSRKSNSFSQSKSRS